MAPTVEQVSERCAVNEAKQGAFENSLSNFRKAQAALEVRLTDWHRDVTKKLDELKNNPGWTVCIVISLQTGAIGVLATLLMMK